MNALEQARFTPLYEALLRALNLQGKAKATIDAYSRAIRRVGGYFDRCPGDDITAEGMALSLHRSERIYHRYYRIRFSEENRASRLLADDTEENRAPTDPSKP